MRLRDSNDGVGQRLDVTFGSRYSSEGTNSRIGLLAVQQVEGCRVSEVCRCEVQAVTIGSITPFRGSRHSLAGLGV